MELLVASPCLQKGAQLKIMLIKMAAGQEIKAGRYFRCCSLNSCIKPTVQAAVPLNFQSHETFFSPCLSKTELVFAT